MQSTTAPYNGKGRVPPHNLDAERALLGTVLNFPDAHKLIGDLRPDDFYKPAHGHVLQVLQAQIADGGRPDLVTVPDALASSGVVTLKEAQVLVAELIATEGTPGNMGRYLDIVRGDARRRDAIALFGEAAGLAYDGRDPAKLLSWALEETQRLVERTNHRVQLHGMKTVVHEYLDLLEDRAAGEGTGLPTGITALDTMVGGGMRAGELWGVLAPPRTGKSALAGNIVYNVAAAGGTVLLVSAEMARLEFMDRVVAAQAGVPLTALRSGKLTDAQRDRVWAVTTGELISSRITILDNPDVTLEEIDVAIARTGADLAVVDYLQLLTPPAGAGTREREVAGISTGLKRIARRRDLPVVALCAVSRAGASRIDQRPTLTDGRDSGQIDHDANVMLGLYRDEVANPDTDEPGVMEIIVLKSRHSAMGTVKVDYDTDTQLITDLRSSSGNPR